MKVPRILLAGATVVLVLGVTGYGTSAVTPQRSASKMTVVPPANFIGTSGADALVGTEQKRESVRTWVGPTTSAGPAETTSLRGGAG